MSQNTTKTINIDGLEIKITKFDFYRGIGIRAMLVRCLLPAIAQLTGEGLKSAKKVNSEDVSKMSTSDLIQEMDGEVLSKAVTALTSNMSNENYTYLINQLLSVCIVDGKQLSNEIEKLFIQEKLSYSSIDKIALEVVKHQGFFGDLVAKLQDKIQNSM